jgi:hypothetical protein
VVWQFNWIVKNWPIWIATLEGRLTDIVRDIDYSVKLRFFVGEAEDICLKPSGSWGHILKGWPFAITALVNVNDIWIYLEEYLIEIVSFRKIRWITAPLAGLPIIFDYVVGA